MDKIALKKKRITRRRYIIKKKIHMNKDVCASASADFIGTCMFRL